jgi:hypothetical protein
MRVAKCAKKRILLSYIYLAGSNIGLEQPLLSVLVTGACSNRIDIAASAALCKERLLHHAALQKEFFCETVHALN